MAEVLSREEFAILKVQATGNGPVYTTELALATLPTIEALAEALSLEIACSDFPEPEYDSEKIALLREKGWIE